MDLIGTSDELARVRNLLPRLSAGDTSVLLIGEPGVSRESVAVRIHRSSRRSDRPFGVVSCAACTEEELFGTPGSPGLLERFGEGTLYLADLDALPMALQVKLARYLDAALQGELELDPPRLICSSRTNLAQLIARGRFRGDLYYRLCAVTVRLPGPFQPPSAMEATG